MQFCHIVSIPHSEFCSFGRMSAPKSRKPIVTVSIPHSEFCSFGRDVRYGQACNDSNVSIPHSEFCSFGHGEFELPLTDFSDLFQFPIRNSVRSDALPLHAPQLASAVSIPHSEFCSFGPRRVAPGASRSGCFNSPFGILFVRTSLRLCCS